MLSTTLYNIGVTAASLFVTCASTGGCKPVAFSCADVSDMGRHKKSSRRHDNHGLTRGESDRHGGYGGYYPSDMPPQMGYPSDMPPQMGYPSDMPPQMGGGYGGAPPYGYAPPSQYTDYSRPPNDYEYEQYDYGAPPGRHPGPPTKEEMEEARQRNFDVWAKWRASMNDSILSDFVSGESRPMKPLEAALHEDDPNPGAQNDPNLLMNYSVATNSVTDLESDQFLKYGIPRAKLNTKNLEYRSLFSANGERHVRVENEQGLEKIYVVRIPVERT